MTDLAVIPKAVASVKAWAGAEGGGGEVEGVNQIPQWATVLSSLTLFTLSPEDFPAPPTLTLPVT